MEPKEEALLTPSEEQLICGEAHNDEFDLETKLRRLTDNPQLFLEDLQREAERWHVKPGDIVRIGTAREVLYRQLCKPGRRISILIEDEDKSHIVRHLYW